MDRPPRAKKFQWRKGGQNQWINPVVQETRGPPTARVDHRPQTISRRQIPALDIHKASNLGSFSVVVDRDHDHDHSDSARALGVSESGQNFTKPSPVQTGKLSLLESLPVEILEHIFLLTLNLSLMRASPHLARKLTSSTLRKELVLRTCTAQPPLVHTSAAFKLFPNDKDLAEVQTALLNENWMTTAFLRRLIPDYMKSVLLFEFSAHQLHWGRPKGPIIGPGLPKKLKASIEDFVDSHFSRVLLLPYGSPDNFMEIIWAEPGLGRVNLGLAPREGLVTLEIYNPQKPYRARHSLLSLSTRCQIPDKLLQGPWSDDKCELLDIIVHGNATVNWIGTTSGELAEGGFWEALKERNAHALRALLFRPSSNSSRSTRASINLPCTMRGVGIVPRPEHLIYAIKDGCRQEIVEALIDAPLTRADLQQGEILRLVLNMEAQKHPQAEWLRHKVRLDSLRRISTSPVIHMI